MKTKLALTVLLVLLGLDTLSQASFKAYPMISDSISYSVVRFTDNGVAFAGIHGTHVVSHCRQSFELKLEIDTAYVGRVMIEIVSPGYPFFYEGFLYHDRFVACFGGSELSFNGENLCITQPGESEPKPIYKVKVRVAHPPVSH